MNDTRWTPSPYAIYTRRVNRANALAITLPLLAAQVVTALLTVAR